MSFSSPINSIVVSWLFFCQERETGYYTNLSKYFDLVYWFNIITPVKYTICTHGQSLPISLYVWGPEHRDIRTTCMNYLPCCRYLLMARQTTDACYRYLLMARQTIDACWCDAVEVLSRSTARHTISRTVTLACSHV